MWFRVREDADSVKRMCVGADKDVVGYPVGWESGMEKTCGKCYRVTVVSREYRKTPVIGLSVADGLVAVNRGSTSTYGWYFPVEALEVRQSRTRYLFSSTDACFCSRFNMLSGVVNECCTVRRIVNRKLASQRKYLTPLKFGRRYAFRISS